MAPDPITHLLNVDIETDGLVIHPDGLLQVAAILTDLDGVEVGEPFMRLVRHTPEQARALRAAADPYVRDMHDQTGIWERCTRPDAVSLDELSEQMMQWLTATVPQRRAAQFAGNSVRFDMNWLEVCTPEVYAHCHYRNIDVTAVLSTLRRFGLVTGQPPAFVGTPHDALDDIRHCIRTYVWMRTQTRPGVLMRRWAREGISVLRQRIGGLREAA